MWDMLATPVQSKGGPGRGAGSIETIFWLIDCSLVTARQMELPNLTTLLLLLTLTALMQCTAVTVRHQFSDFCYFRQELYAPQYKTDSAASYLYTMFHALALN